MSVMASSTMSLSEVAQQHRGQPSEGKSPKNGIADEKNLKHLQVSLKKPKEREGGCGPENTCRVTARTRSSVSGDK
jgi:hypothetical protein